MASLEDVLKRFGAEQSVVKNADNLNTPLEQYIKEVSQSFIELMIERIDKGNPDFGGGSANASYRLRQSFLVDTKSSGGDVSTEFSSDEKYALWRNDGVSGTERMRDTQYQYKSTHPSVAMVTDIEKWIIAKGFEAPSWAVATNVLKFGFDGARFIEAAFSEDNLVELEDNILTITGNTLTAMFSKVIPEFK